MSNYYNIDKVLKLAETEKSNFIFIYGGKSKGKSYQCKLKLMINEYLKSGKRFCLVRRYKDEITKSKVELYFSDIERNIDLWELSKEKFNKIVCISNKIYFAFLSETGKILSKEHIGYSIPLNIEQNFSSILNNKDIKNIIFEEFQSRTIYLTDEFTKLMFLYSTIDRNQGSTKLWFIGNAINKSCPYWEELGLINTIKKQKEKTIEKVTYNNFLILLEKTGNFNAKETTIGISSKSITGGNWLSSPQQKTTLKGCKRGLFYLHFEFKGLKYVGELCKNDKKLFWFIYATEKFKKEDKTFLITDKITNNYLCLHSVYNLNINIVKDTFLKTNLFFANDETGTDFFNLVSFRIKDI